MKRNAIGSTFDSFLEEEGILEEVDALAQKRIIAWQIEQAMAEQSINKVDMAERMKTSRSQVDRLLDPNNNRVQLDTLQRAATAVGASLRLELTGIRVRKAASRSGKRKTRAERRRRSKATDRAGQKAATKRRAH